MLRLQVYFCGNQVSNPSVKKNLQIILVYLNKYNILYLLQLTNRFFCVIIRIVLKRATGTYFGCVMSQLFDPLSAIANLRVKRSNHFNESLYIDFLF